MVALMLPLARRAGEAASLLLEDVDWRLRMLSVRGRGNRLDRVPFPADIGRPLARYLRSGAPHETAHRQVSLARDAPHGPLTAPAAESVATRAMARGGTTGPGAGRRPGTPRRGGCAAGGGFAAEREVTVPHQPYATTVYARSDIAALRSIARPWPGAAR